MEKNTYLFVYGTLMSHFKTPIANYLRENSNYIGKGYFHGLLYDLGNYPGAVYKEDKTKKVYGEIYTLKDFMNSIKILDDYEGINDPVFNIYKREIIKVFSNNTEYECYTYLYKNATNKLKIIDGGNYLLYLNI
ncbi:gamma-glutamylcyclotransferase family protein [Abyssalbus ytuae]|uniref:Gamma-glutamylcyclotransferase n=1 Tax=Abyssalbus ytuae TaxID=2926907 RepID=A0A9E7D1K7_9FLAO|nr:gamma-glutamylcyclotransferase family protein [Abyssalbus ytuae]UOB17213.1 gamma-glutamylcyclotransferase [Abyssalbus ytuae]